VEVDRSTWWRVYTVCSSSASIPHPALQTEQWPAHTSQRPVYYAYTLAIRWHMYKRDVTTFNPHVPLRHTSLNPISHSLRLWRNLWTTPQAYCCHGLRQPFHSIIISISVSRLESTLQRRIYKCGGPVRYKCGVHGHLALLLAHVNNFV